MSIGVPIKLLHEAEGHTVTMELKVRDSAFFFFRPFFIAFAFGFRLAAVVLQVSRFFFFFRICTFNSS
jgi:hypothetical protein